MVFRLLNRAKMSVSGTPGTGTITLGSADIAYQSFAAAGIANLDTVKYLIEDGTAWEIGYGTYTSASTHLARTVLIESSTGSKISATSAAKVSVIADAQQIAAGGWVPLTFSTTTTIFGIAGTGVSDQTFTLADGDFIEIEGYIYKLTANSALLAISSDASTGYALSEQSDGNDVLYRYNGSFSTMSSSGTNSSQTWTGKHRMMLSLSVQDTGTTDNRVWGSINAYNSNFVNNSNVSFIGTCLIYAVSDDFTKTAVRARVASSHMFGG